MAEAPLMPAILVNSKLCPAKSYRGNLTAFATLIVADEICLSDEFFGVIPC